MPGIANNPEVKSNQKFKWMPVFTHFGIAILFALSVRLSASLYELIAPLTIQLASLIPSIAGYAAISSDPGFTQAFLLVAWVGMPYHVFEWAQILPPVLRPWAHQQGRMEFWVKIVIFIALAISAWALPTAQYYPTDATQSVRAVSLWVSLMKEYFPLLLLVSFSLVFVFSFLFATALVGGYLRLFSIDDQKNKRLGNDDPGPYI